VTLGASSATLAGMSEPTEDSRKEPEGVDGLIELSDAEAVDTPMPAPETALAPGPRTRARQHRRRVPGLIVAAVLVGAGVFLALRGMQQVVARAPATPVPAAISTPAPTSNEGPPLPTPQPTPMPTSSALILEP
jgi:hypothetical protein